MIEQHPVSSSLHRILSAFTTREATSKQTPQQHKSWQKNAISIAKIVLPYYSVGMFAFAV